MLTQQHSHQEKYGVDPFQDLELSGSSDESGLEEDSSEDESSSGSEESKTTRVTRNFDLFRSPTNQGQLFVAVGKSERGKSHFVRALLTHQLLQKNGFEFGLLFVPDRKHHDYDFMPNKRVIQGFNEEVLQQYIENLMEISDEVGNKKMPPNFIIFDDMVGILANMKAWFINWITIYRHYNTTMFFNVQYLSSKNAISPVMREQTTAAIMFNSRTKNTLMNLYEAYGGLFEDYQQFKDYFISNTSKQNVGPYAAMVYFEREDEIENNYLIMRAPKDIPEIKLHF